ILVRSDGTTLRNYLLQFTPDQGPVRTLVQQLVRPNLVVQATTCWQGRPDPNFEQPALSFFLLPYALSAPGAAVDLARLVDARIESLRTESSSKPDLPVTTTVGDLLGARPAVKNLYFGAWPYDAPLRERWEQPAATAAMQLAAAPSDQWWDRVIALALAKDFE